MTWQDPSPFPRACNPNSGARASSYLSFVSDGFFDQSETVVVLAAVELLAAWVACDRAAKRPDAGGDDEAGRAGVGMLPFHLPAFQGQGMGRGLAGDADLRAGGTPLRAVGGDAAPAAALVGDEVGELMLERPPDLLLGDFPDLWV